jgi:hypothetical protein
MDGIFTTMRIVNSFFPEPGADTKGKDDLIAHIAKSKPILEEIRSAGGANYKEHLKALHQHRVARDFKRSFLDVLSGKPYAPLKKYTRPCLKALKLQGVISHLKPHERKYVETCFGHGGTPADIVQRSVDLDGKFRGSIEHYITEGDITSVEHYDAALDQMGHYLGTLPPEKLESLMFMAQVDSVIAFKAVQAAVLVRVGVEAFIRLAVYFHAPYLFKNFLDQSLFRAGNATEAARIIEQAAAAQVAAARITAARITAAQAAAAARITAARITALGVLAAAVAGAFRCYTAAVVICNFSVAGALVLLRYPQVVAPLKRFFTRFF